jgi:hypothetical protein
MAAAPWREERGDNLADSDRCSRAIEGRATATDDSAVRHRATLPVCNSWIKFRANVAEKVFKKSSRD